MPDWSKIWGGSRIGQDLMQYPDDEVYNAAALLRPEDRPKVQVIPTDDPASIFARYQGYPDDALPEAFVLPTKDKIYVNRRKQSVFKNPHRLAANLGHEQHHIGGADERAARLKEIEILEGMGREKKQVQAIKKFYNIK